MPHSAFITKLPKTASGRRFGASQEKKSSGSIKQNKARMIMCIDDGKREKRGTRTGVNKQVETSPYS